MTYTLSDDISVVLTSYCLKIGGFWTEGSRVDQLRRNVTLVCGLLGIFWLSWILVVDIYYSRNDVGTCLYIFCNILTLSLAFIKLFILLLHKEEFFSLIAYLRQTFLRSDYDSYEKTILNECRRVCILFVCSFTGFSYATIVTYIMRPIVANIGKNVSDRVLPFKVWADGVTVTPKFEILFMLQVWIVCQSGFYYFSFDNFLCIMNLHAAGQFRILQYRLVTMNSARIKLNPTANSADGHYAIFKGYVRQHQALIAYCKQLEKAFSIFALVQVLMFSLLICFVGYQILMADAPLERRIIFICHIGGGMSQLFMFTYSCDCLIRESTNVAAAMYAAPWTEVPMNQSGKMLRKDSLLVIMRSNIPCSLSACGFSTISLETYTKVLSTAVSYFTLLKQNL